MAGNPSWKAGVSGNPNGRPRKGKTLNEILERFGRQTVVDDDGKRRSRQTILSRKLWESALAGDVNVAKYLFDRIGGKAIEKVEVSSEDGGPIGIVFLPKQKTPDEWINDNNGKSVGTAAEATTGSELSG